MATLSELVVTELKVKKDSGFESPAPIGTAAKYVSAVRGATINNIEEQFLIGCDCITTTTTYEDESTFVKKEFRSEGTTTNYYILETYNFANPTTAKHFLKNNSLYLPNDTNDNRYEQETGDNSYSLVGEDSDVYSLVATTDATKLDIEATSYSETPVESYSVLKYKGESSAAIIEVIKKTTYIAEKQADGTMVQKQVIQNLL